MSLRPPTTWLSNMTAPHIRCPDQHRFVLDLMVQTNVWCSSGAVMPNGTLIQTGGSFDGERKVRIFDSCSTSNDCDWVEINNGLAVKRWYPTNHILPDDRQVVIGGRAQFNYDFLPKNGGPILHDLPFSAKTNDVIPENNLCPFVFLIGDTNLFIYGNNQSIL
ncbi:hypothetical protein Ddye_007206 [Dipteronia dyeriana]|uniref:Glyoxal oxidase N-terminal domain-containing protein n=1 Tax=Dipteronia dyeriana TaxID=168575 RepID=A0AAE0CRX5_9ROSI|nr:hypothetical protein Ddye_007206 [Dipteronia dyeriana]